MVTVIIPTYNNEDTIERCILSVINQTYKDWKILIVNDCSTDNTINVINNEFKSYLDKIKIIHNPENYGVGKSRKIGVLNTDTEFLTFLDSDDYLLPEYLETSMFLQKIQDADVVYTSTTIILDKDHQKTLEVPECIMEGHISPTLHVNIPKKWLTGKLFRTYVMKKIPMSEKRIGEDVNTLFYACYNAKKVRSSQYSGYVHLYRPNSLIGIGTDNPFNMYCLSTVVDIELFDYIIDKKDWEAFKAMIQIPYYNYKRHQQMVVLNQFKKDDLEMSYMLWTYITDWYNKNEKLIKKYIQ